MDVTHIIHISDIHIRHGDNDKSRYNEYKYVFDNFISSIKNLECVKNKSSLIVITGDLFHNKGKFDTPAAKLYFNWFHQLLHISHIIIICGNHDFRQEDPDHPDVIDVLSNPFINNSSYPFKLTYLKDTGIYDLFGISFGILSIKDILRKFNTSGTVDYENIPSFPTPPSNNNIKIALFHGLNWSPDWFKNYDFVLLGDNHKQQIAVNDTYKYTWGYAGSLIQQDFGETIINHGYILWDIKNNNATPFDIFNKYSLVIIKKHENNYITTNYSNIKNNCPDISNLNIKYPRIKFIGNIQDENDLVNNLKKLNIKFKDLSTTIPFNKSINNQDNDDNHIISAINQMSDLNRSDKWIEYLNSIGISDDTLFDFINNPDLIKLNINIDTDDISNDIKKRIIDRTSKLDCLLDEYKQSLATSNKKGKYKIILQYMSWDYILCYGPHNYFDFNKLEGKVALLNGRNASGKSAFLDTLCIGLYGEPSKQRNIQNKKLTCKMIHDQRPKDHSMKVNIIFYCDDELFEISRTFGQQDNWARTISASIYKIDISNSSKNIICEGTTMVNDWINNHFGTLDEILMSSIISQIDINNFFYMKSEEQKAILDKSLNLDSIGIFGKYLHESILAHNDIIQSISTVVNTINGIIQNKPKITISKDKIDNLEKDIQNKSEILQNKRIELQNLITFIGNDFTFKSNISDIIQFEKDIKIINKKINDFNINDDDKLKMNSIIAIKQSELSKLKNELDTIDIIDINNIHNNDLSIEEYSIVLNDKLKNINIHYSKDYINKKEIEYNQWIKKQKKEWINNIDELINYKEEMTSVLNDLYDKHSKSSLDNNKKYNLLINKYNTLIHNPINLIMTEKEICDWEIKYNKWKEIVKDVDNENSNSSDELKSQYDKYDEFIKTYNLKKNKNDNLIEEFSIIENELKQIKDIPYNPDCWACNKQPMQIRKKQLNDNFDKIKISIDKLKKYFDKHNNIQDIKNNMNILHNIYKNRKYFEDTKDFYIDNQNKYIKAKDIFNKYTSWKKELDETKIETDNLKHNLNTIRQQLEDDILKIKNELTDINLFINENTSFVELKKTIDYEKNKHDTFDNIEQQINIIKIYLHRQNLINKINDIETDELKKYIDYNTLINNRNDIEKNIAYIKSRSLKNDIILIDKEIQEYISEYGIIKKLSVDSKEHENKCNILEDLLNKLKIKKDKLTLLENKFIGNNKITDDDTNSYKEWIYKYHVIPLLQNEVNKFLEPFENIRLNISYNGKNLVHFIYDRGNLPTLDMSSGYQKFIIAIALRLALAKIGSIGQNVRHLYIDEGFTACDSINIEKSNIILKNIMEYGNYHSIILMSHLDIIRDITDIRIDINRASNDIFSQIKWGNEYPKYNKTKNDIELNKKRGRPSKK